MEGSYLTEIEILLEKYITPNWIDEKYNNFKQGFKKINTQMKAQQFRIKINGYLSC